MALLIGCLVLLVVAVVLLGLFQDLLYSAVGLAVASIMLSIVLFQFGANIAAVFELSVCAGLITVLFVSTVSLTKDSDQSGESRLPARFLLPMLVVFTGVALTGVTWLASHVGAASGAARGSFQEIFWGQRSTDVLGQIAIILAGVLGMLAVLRVKLQGGHHD
ncbi:MAG TPA: NADH-quinone oxidoreductase subunit J [Thermoanaerobaculaceae bacterium]|nr:NADH-quinone oxidoreductase subunit J [Thermoanaerobaculaceae bacterium]HPS77330.1 NADH-quinone oxidoreductase subunit J [Thermoanaerobaculaceae bacterium]